MRACFPSVPDRETQQEAAFVSIKRILTDKMNSARKY